MSKEDANYYALIPANVRYDDKLSSSEKLMYGEITCLTNKYGYCFASNKYFADLYKVSKSSISSWIKSLCDNGYIHVNYKRKGKQITQRNITLSAVNRYKKGVQNSEQGYSENHNHPIQKIERGYSENLKGNTTSNNNTRDNNDHHQNQKNRIPDLNSDDPNATIEMSKEAILRKKFMDKVGNEFASPDEVYEYMNYCVYEMTDFWNHLKRQWGISKASRRKIINATKEFSTWAYSKRVKAKPPKTMLPMLKSFMKEIDVRDYKLVN